MSLRAAVEADFRPADPDGAFGEPERGVEMAGLFDATWATPGSHIASAIGMEPGVRFVLERFDGDRSSVVVVLDDDPEPLLDAIFDAERELYEVFKDSVFDVRVTKPPRDWDSADLVRTSIVRHRRPYGI
jgi:hypothetical protein